MMRAAAVVITLCTAWTSSVSGESRSFNSLLNSSQTGRSTEKPDEILYKAWGIDILISNSGFGLGGFYRREYTPDVSGFLSLSVSESKDDREVEFSDPYTGDSYTPGKLNRFFVIPLSVGAQIRLFREDIVDTFRPYVNAAIGPTMIFAAQYTEITYYEGTQGYTYKEIEFFTSLGMGKAYYTVGGYIGFGANFGSDKSNLFGVNFRYYITYLFSEGLPSLFNPADPTQPPSLKTNFGGFFITLNVGTMF